MAALPCTIYPRPKGTPFHLPNTLVEARVLKLENRKWRPRPNPFAVVDGQWAVFEVSRSVLGEVAPGTRVEREWPLTGCADRRLAPDSRVLLADFNGYLEVYDAVAPGESFGSYLRLIDARPVWRHGGTPALARVRLGGAIQDEEAQAVLERVPVDAPGTCDIVADEELALVSCGNSHDTRRPRWLFERDEQHWIEVGRWPPARATATDASGSAGQK